MLTVDWWSQYNVENYNSIAVDCFYGTNDTEGFTEIVYARHLSPFSRDILCHR